MALRASSKPCHHLHVGDSILSGLLLVLRAEEEEGGVVCDEVKTPLTLLPPVALDPVHDADVEHILHLELDWGSAQPPVPLA